MSQPFLIVRATDDDICEEVNNHLTEFGYHVLFLYDTTFDIGMKKWTTFSFVGLKRFIIINHSH